MKILTQEFKKYVDIDKFSRAEMEDYFNNLAFEVEEVIKTNSIKGVRLGKVLSSIKHPNADNLSYCQVETNGEIYDVICGGKNIKKGQIVAHAFPGTYVNNIKLEKKIIRGIMSHGMVLSVSEIGGFEKKFVENEEVENIFVFSNNVNLNDDLLELSFFKGEVYNLSILPDRNYANNYLTIANELSVYTNQDFRLPKFENNYKEKLDLNVKLGDKATSLYCSKIKLEKSKTPHFIKAILYHSDFKPTNTILDLIAYVMLITGNVLYFIPNSKSVELNDRNLIYDNKKIDIVKSSPILENKNEGLIVSISSKFKGNTVNEKDYNTFFGIRQLKSIEKKYSKYALEMFLNLANKYGFVNEFSSITGTEEKTKKLSIELSDEYIYNYIGNKFDLSKIKEKLIKLDFNIKGDKYTVPQYRSDITTKQDIIEEIVRFYGVNNIQASKVLPQTLEAIIPEKHKYYNRKIIELFSSYGFSEIKTYHLLNETNAKKYNIWHNDKFIKLNSKYNFEFNYLQTSLFFGLLETHKYNYRRENRDIRLFEISNVFHNKKPKFTLGVIHDDDINPENPEIVTKSLVVELFKLFNIDFKEIVFKQNNNALFNNYVSADIYYNDKLVGKVGEIHPKILRENKYIRIDKIKNKLYYFEIIIDELFKK